MTKTLWNTNLFFQIIELTIAALIFLFNKGESQSCLIGVFLAIFYIHSFSYSAYCLDSDYWDGDKQKRIDYLKTHIWFLYLFIPFTAFRDTYELAHGTKIRVDIKGKKVEVKKRKDTYTVELEDCDDMMTIVNENNNPNLFKALAKALKEKLIP